MIHWCKFCQSPVVPVPGMRDFCSLDCKVAYQNACNVAKQRRYFEKQSKLEQILNSTYAIILAKNSVVWGSKRNFRYWIHEQISETLTNEEIDDLIKQLLKCDQPSPL